MPRISIITPVYCDTGEKIEWLAEMLQSVKEQSFVDWEVILIDDCSPLLLGAVKLQFENETRFRWLRASRNQGPAACRNTAAALAESDCLLPVDSDDMLATPDALQQYYDVWSLDKTKIVYGNLHRLTNQNGHWERGRPITLADYTFERVMNLNGLFPVTAMHSVSCHKAAGGWKPALQFGLEDVEYWISAGRAGYCGQHINHLALAYRRHEQSRSFNLRYGNLNEDVMKRQIMDIHRDCFEGNMACGGCGKSGNAPAVNQVQAQAVMAAAPKVTYLEGVPDSQKIWVQYNGGRDAGFNIFGRAIKGNYRILGKGHKFQIHLDDVKHFRSQREGSRGGVFLVGVPSPSDEPEPEPQVIEAPRPTSEYNGGEPALAELERLDAVAVATRGIEPQSEPVAAVEAAPMVDDIHPASALPQPNGPAQATGLEVLELSENIAAMLEAESWTVEKLAEATPDDLIAYPGIGPKRSQQIVDSAKLWLDRTQ